MTGIIHEEMKPTSILVTRSSIEPAPAVVEYSWHVHMYYGATKRALRHAAATADEQVASQVSADAIPARVTSLSAMLYRVYPQEALYESYVEPW